MGRFEAALLLVMFLALLSDLGLWSALVQRRQVTDRHFSTAFWTCLVSGTIVAALTTHFGPQAIESVTLAIGRLLAWIGMPGTAAPAGPVTPDEYAPILSILSLLLPCAAVSGLFRARLQRDLRFRQIAFAEVGSVVVYAAFVLATLESLGIMSAVIGAVIREAALLVGLIIAARWLPRASFGFAELRQISSFGLHFTGSRAVNYVASSLPAIVVLSALGEEAMGYYSFALHLTLLPLMRISTILTRIFFPAFSAVQEDDGVLRRGYLKTSQSIALFYWPAMAVVFVFAIDGIGLMRELRGQDLSQALLPLRLLVVATMLKAVGTGVGSMFLAKGKANWTLYWSVFSLIVLLPLLLWNVSHGVAGVSAVMAATALLFLVLSQWLTNRLIALRFADYLGALARPAMVTGCLLLALTFLRPQLLGGPLAVCLQAAVASALLGGLTLRLFAWDLCMNLWRNLRGRAAPASAGPGTSLDGIPS